MKRAPWVLVALVIVSFGSPASAFESAEIFAKGAKILSIEGGGGEDDSFETHRVITDLTFWNAGVRLSYLPFGVAGSRPLFGALEVGVEPFYQRYTGRVDAFYAGLAAVARYHFLSLGRVVPYVEVAGAAGGTDLNILEIDSDFAFLLFGGGGASVFVADRIALYAGYRLQHVSNGGTESRNRGFESHTGVIGISTYFK
jgi:hypothetical protein